MSKEVDSSSPYQPWSNYPRSHGHQADEQLGDPPAARLAQNQGQVTPHSREHNPNYTPNTTRAPERTGIPTRAATLKHADPDRSLSASAYGNHARSEDLNHTASQAQHTVTVSSSPRPAPAFLASSRSSTPGSNIQSGQPPSPENPETLNHRPSIDSLSSATSDTSETSNLSKQPTASTTSSGLTSSTCTACGKPMQGPFVRALGTVFHLNCFKCMDCGDVVASKFFPIDSQDGRQHPLCERDYFRRLNLICAKCNMALRGSYITACNKKFHVEHFTCSLCPTLFGPQDSYYEHEGDVYCHFHYSTRFATKCAGCNSAILKQFVEINRNMRDECWHPECYMINKFWNVKVVSRRPTSSLSVEEPSEPAYLEEEKRETPASLKEKQYRMEQQVYRIWTVLSAFEESSAACISDMLRQVSNGQYLDAIRMAEKFILHVEVLFATIDDLEYHFARLHLKGMSHVREARMLCRKTVELFTLLSHTQETGARRMGMTQELLALVTGLAHYLKILIRIALTGALKLEKEHNVREAMTSFLDKLHLLAVQGANPSARRMIKGQNGEMVLPTPNGGNYGTQAVTYGFRSLAPENAGDPPFREGSTKPSSSNPPSDLCVKCNLTVEEDCVRLGTYQRWHSHCVQCAQCGKVAAVLLPKEIQAKNGESKESKEPGAKDQPPKLSSARRPPANVGLFMYDPESRREVPSFGEVPTVVLCTEHAHGGCRGGFQPVERLEQYAFLLNVALRRLYLLLKKQGVVPLSPVSTGYESSSENTDPYRNSADIMRMKAAVHLDRKLSATARLPKRSTIVESPTGKSAHPSDVNSTQRHLEHVAAQHVQQVNQSSPHPQPYQVGPQSAGQMTPTLNRFPIDPTGQASGQLIRPAFARNNTEVMIVDDSGPNSPAEGHPPIPHEEGITLADIPQIMEVAQAREQQRSLPRENAIPYIAELSPLELAIVKHCAVLVLMKSPLKDQFDLDDLLEFVELKKANFWKTIFKSDKKNLKKKGVFGVPLDLLVEREGSDSLLGATRATLRVPSFIDDVISAMKQMDMSIEGIFRKNGNIRRLKDLTEAIDRDPSSVDLTTDNPVQLAALLKKFLRDLPDPLLTFKLHKLLIASQSLPSDIDRKRYLHMISLLLPKSHRDTLEVLSVFLKWVASFAHMDAETGSKMDLGNLATVIAPSIIYARGRDAVRDETFGALRVVTSLLENQDEFFTVPVEFLGILHDQEYFTNAMELPAKDFLKKCDTYMKLKGTNGRAVQIQNGLSTPRPIPMGPSQSDRGYRPPPSTAPSYQGPPPGSPPIPPPASTQQMLQRNPHSEGWVGQPPPRSMQATPRPTSTYLPPRQDDMQPPGPISNGAPLATRQQST